MKTAESVGVESGTPPAGEEVRIKDLAIASSINGVAFGDLQGRVTYVNEAFLKMWGGTRPSEVIGKPAEVFARSKGQAEKIIRTVLEKGGWEGEIEGKKKDGSFISLHLSASLVRNERGEPVCLMCSFVDVTERKCMEEEMRVKEFAIDSSINGVAFGDMEGRVTYANRAFLKMWGSDRPEEVIGMHAVEFAADQEEAWAAFNAVLSRGRWIGEITGRRKDGVLIDVQLSANLVADAGGTPFCMLCTFVDVTERRKAEKELNRAMENLEALVEKRTQALSEANKKLKREVVEHRKTEKVLRRKEEELQLKSRILEETNTALKVLLKRMEKDRDEQEEKVLASVKELVLPYVEKLSQSPLNSKQETYLRILESNIENIVSPFLKKLSSAYLDLTPSQIQVAEFIRAGKRTKEIAELMNISDRTVEFHRNKIRTKLGLTNRKANLRTYLMSVS